MLTLQNMPRARYTGDAWALGLRDVDAFDALPPTLRDALAYEAQDPEFLHGYLLPALRTPDPYEHILADMARELEAERRGLAGYMGHVGMDGLDDLGKSFFKRIGSAVKRVAKKAVDVHKRVAKKVIIDPHKKLYEIHKKVAKKIAKGAKKVWVKYGNIIIGVLGAVLAPFTGGASLAAAAVITAANTMYMKKRAADQAKKMARADAAAVQAEANAANAETLRQVDEFFNNNRDWFAQYGITPDKWAQLTLDQKVELIRAGSEGRLPAGSRIVGQEGDGAASTTGPGDGTASSSTSTVARPTAPPDPGGWGGGGGGAPGASPPPYVTGGGGGGGGGAPAPYDYATQEQSAARAAAAPTGAYDIFIEGQKAGTFQTMPEATNAILSQSKRGDRLEIVYNGQSLGLRLRTSGGSIDVPADIEAAVRTMDRAKMEQIVTNAEKQLGQGAGGGVPWGWILAAGGAAIALAA